jgi:hypothetical protein
MVHYATAEITEVSENASTLVLKTEPGEFTAELTVSGYRCDEVTVIEDSGERSRIRITGEDGEIVLRKL